MKVVLQCEGCGQIFERERREFNRSRRLGRQFFCSLQCLGLHRDNSIYKNCPGNPQYLIANNLRDMFTLFRWYMARIRQRKHKVSDLTIEDLVKQWEGQQGRCPYTGWELLLPDSTIGWSQGAKPNCASLDRIDSKQGYINGNVVFVAVMYNYAKNAFGNEEVIAFCKAVASHVDK